MNFNEKEFLNIYHRKLKENDIITEKIKETFRNDNAQDVLFIKKCNDLFNIPPLLTFIILKSDKDFLKIIKKEFAKNANKQYYGMLFGYIFTKYNYKEKKKKSISKELKEKTNLNNASYFIKK